MSAFHWSRHFCHQVLLRKCLQLASLPYWSVQTDFLSSCSVKTVNLKKLMSRCHITNVLSKFCYCLQAMALSWKVGWIVKTDDDTVNDMWQLQETLEDLEENSERYIFASFCWSPLKTGKYCCFRVNANPLCTHRDEIGCLHKTDNVIRPPAGLGFEKWVKMLFRWEKNVMGL